MQINIDNKQNFGSLKSYSNLMNRLNNPTRHKQYNALVYDMEKCIVDCLLTADKNGRLTAKFRSQNFSDLPEVKENYFSALLNLSPIKFITEACKTAKKLEIDEKDLLGFNKKCGRINCETEI